jgi:hypothetical protein
MEGYRTRLGMAPGFGGIAWEHREAGEVWHRLVGLSFGVGITPLDAGPSFGSSCLRWCARQRSPARWERLRRAQAQAAAEAEKRRVKQLGRQVAQLAAERGLSDQRCLAVGCTEKALASMHVCAKHSITGRRDSLK